MHLNFGKRKDKNSVILRAKYGNKSGDWDTSLKNTLTHMIVV